MDQKTAFKILRKYINFLKENNINIRKAYLFGSYATGNFNEDSDIDVAIILNNLHDDFDMQVYLMKLRRKFDTRIEPHPFDEKDFSNPSIPLVNQILRTGIPIMWE